MSRGGEDERLKIHVRPVVACWERVYICIYVVSFRHPRVDFWKPNRCQHQSGRRVVFHRLVMVD